jgi:UDP-N-acetyl-D-glucosamine dehydrogenase
VKRSIPFDPYYLSWKARSNGFEARFIELADQINGYMPHYVVSRVGDALNTKHKSINGPRILILGVAYKPNVGDTRESPAVEFMHLLSERGAELSYVDPYVPELTVDGMTRKTCALTAAVLAGQDCVLILTDHRQVDYGLVAAAAPLVVDTRHALRGITDQAEAIKL